MDNEALTAKVEALKSMTEFLKNGDKSFAIDLIHCFKTKGSLSVNQWPWVDKLIARATNTEPQPEKEEVGDFSGVIKLFKTAQAHIKYPKIVLQVGTQPLALSVAGPSAKAPGTVNVTDGRPFGQNVWFGRVTPTGVWEKSSQGTEDEVKAVGQFLKKFGQDPAGTAKACAILTGRCCFCNSKLTDEKSTSAGFGPVCAKNFGLESEWKIATSVFQEELATT